MVWLKRAAALLHIRRYRMESKQRAQAIALHDEGGIDDARRILAKLVDEGAQNEWTWLWAARVELATLDADLAVVARYLQMAVERRRDFALAHDLQSELDASPVLVPVLGLRGVDLLNITLRLQREFQPEQTLFVTNALDFKPLTAAGINFEFMPESTMIAAMVGAEKSAHYTNRRLSEIAEERNACRIATELETGLMA